MVMLINNQMKTATRRRMIRKLPRKKIQTTKTRRLGGNLTRIRKAQTKGKQDVKLNKAELAALERRRKRLQAEAESKKRNGSDGRRRKEKDQRYAVPLSHFDSGPSVSDEALARRALPSALEQSEQLPGPPMGRFPPPSAARARPRSGTSSTSSTYRPQSRAQDSPPFDYQYVHTPPNQRHASDPSARPGSRLSLPHEDEWRPPSSSSSRGSRDPFQYQTAGPRALYADNAAAARLASSRRTAPTTRSSSRRAVNREERNEQEHEDDTTSDEGATGARFVRDGTREEIVVEHASPSPEPERPKGKKALPPSQPAAKRKSGGKKRKGK
ncbi:hypothetical protein F4819DRAFT_408305 [Hypoxylon fuscum]|nr:hypothetical protein F4819DRAFT_408305 [Hypoxylon fuscum]